MKNYLFILNFLLLVLLHIANISHASPDTPGVFIKYNGASHSHRQFLDSCLNGLSQNILSHIINIDVTNSATRNKSISNSDLVIAVGTQLCKSSVVTNQNVLCTLIPKQSFKLIQALEPAKATNIGAVFIDQPIVRQLRFSRLLLPGASKMGVLISDYTQDKLSAITQLTLGTNLQATPIVVETRDSINAQVIRKIQSQEFILAPLDPITYSPLEAKRLLYAAYDKQIPVIAFSKSFVEAGALGAIYATPQLVGKQTGEIISNGVSSGNFHTLPNQYSKYFELSINKSLARSFRLNIPDETEILAKLLSTTRTDIFAGK